MRLVYLYARERQINLEHYEGEGVHLLFTELDQGRVYDEIIVFFESTSGIAFTHEFTPTYRLVSSPTPPSTNLITNGDIIWVRGGFKPWLDFIQYFHDQQSNWMLFYGANTGNERWPFWHVVFDDLNFDPPCNEGHWWEPAKHLTRVTMHYVKPLNHDVFNVAWGHQDLKVPDYDICIGASNIHDKKGQWLAVRTLDLRKLRDNVEYRAVMPGAYRRSTETLRMIHDMEDGTIDLPLLHTPGTVSRKHLAAILNRSKVFIHLGPGGQGDRGPLEALACGCQVILGNESRHCKMLSRRSNQYVQVLQSPTNKLQVLYAIDKCLQNVESSIGFRTYVGDYFCRNYGIAFPYAMMKWLKAFFSEYRTPQCGDIRELFNGIVKHGYAQLW